MIYNYETKKPVEISQEEANKIFTAFYFDTDENMFFIYPEKKIIYNYTIGVFFRDEGNKRYKEIKLCPIITLSEMGEYIGYTQGDPNQLPTLYYENGRLTLQHANCANIGWHPRKTEFKFVCGNILHPNNPKVFERKTVYDYGEFLLAVAAVDEENFDESKLIELHYDDKSIIRTRHVSRSQLILSPAPNFELNEVSLFPASKELRPSPLK